MATLYELTGQYQLLLALMEDPDVDPQLIDDSLEAVSGEIEAKADGYAKVRLELLNEKAGLKAEIERLSARVRTIDRNVDRMMESLKNGLIAADKPKFKTELFSFTIAKNPPKVVIDCEADIPEAFLIPQPAKVDTAAIKKSLQSEDEAPIWEGVAHLESSMGLRIR